MDGIDFWGSGGQPASAQQTLTDTNVSQPAWLQDYTRALMGSSVAAASEPYQEYSGARIAGQDPLSQQAEAMTQANVGAWKPTADFASQTAPGQVGAYMNPYQDQVVNRIAQLGQQNLTQNLMPQVNSTFSGAGQFGGSRNAEFMNRALADTQREVLGAQGQALSEGYKQATSAFQNDATRLGNLSPNIAQMGAADASQLDILGRSKQAENQRNLDLNYNEFQNQVNAPKQNLSFLNEMLRGLPNTMSTTANKVELPAAQNVSSPLLAAAQAFSGVKQLTSPLQQATTQARTTI